MENDHLDWKNGLLSRKVVPKLGGAFMVKEVFSGNAY